ncbi:MAG: Hsp20/alpha crystallin family protein [Bacillota bacterium]|jgi:HSP20 family protein|nr:Hsp20/alpha crystallin family protein [Bacillota bacterium]MDD3298484.1 Hsp20/alpha crystallin family protein [Bacillota bacterium]MDD3851243.1 Hsp20/alpha crystallin family protein [Bacillota bacterium]MDD4707083.1 Hsp20/alpha crystallin family protein [Bacillota bacterium]
MFDLTPFRKDKSYRGLIPDGLWENFFETGFPATMDYTLKGMRVDIREEEDRYLLEADLPGFNKDDIGIQLKDNIITITAQHNEDFEEKGDSYLRRERRSGRLIRNFMVDNVKQDSVSAKYENGVLKVLLPKENKRPIREKRIDIQ